MEYLEATWTRALKVWWSLAWRLTVFGLVAGILVGLPVAMVAGTLGLGPLQAELLLHGLTIPLWIIIGVWVVRWVLRLEYADFRIALVPSTEARLAARYEAEEGTSRD